MYLFRRLSSSSASPSGILILLIHNTNMNKFATPSPNWNNAGIFKTSALKNIPFRSDWNDKTTIISLMWSVEKASRNVSGLIKV
jgi:hypothetical protein